MSQLVHADHLQWAFARLLIVVGVTGLLVGAVGFVHFPCKPEDSFFLLLGASVIGPAATVAVLAHLRERRWARTVAYAVGTGFGSLVIFAILVPGGRPVPHRARVAVAMEHMRKLGRQLEAGQQISRATDPWGDPYVVYTTSSGYTVISYGECGQPDVPPGETYSVGPTASREADLVYTNGEFVRYPEVRSR
jgi:hypothetical protein